MSRRNIFWGVIFVLAAVLIIVSQFTSFITLGFWSILAGVLLAAAFVSSLVRLNFTGMFFSLSLLYTVFHGALGWPDINVWILLVASLIAGWGMSMLVKRRARPGWDHRYNWQRNAPAGELPPAGEYGAGVPEQNYENFPDGGDSNHPRASVSFGANTRYLHADALEYGQFSASFGAIEVYFDGATLADNQATVDCSANFGAVTLYVPRHWRVEDRVTVFLGGVENDRKLATPAEDGPLLVVTGSASFGAVAIEYV